MACQSQWSRTVRPHQGSTDSSCNSNFDPLSVTGADYQCAASGGDDPSVATTTAVPTTATTASDTGGDDSSSASSDDDGATSFVLIAVGAVVGVAVVALFAFGCCKAKVAAKK